MKSPADLHNTSSIAAGQAKPRVFPHCRNGSSSGNFLQNRTLSGIEARSRRPGLPVMFRRRLYGPAVAK
jgi:hypothetical protein